VWCRNDKTLEKGKRKEALAPTGQNQQPTNRPQHSRWRYVDGKSNEIGWLWQLTDEVCSKDDINGRDDRRDDLNRSC